MGFAEFGGAGLGGLVWGFGGWSVVVVVGVGRWLAAAGLLVVGARCLVVCGLRQLFCGSCTIDRGRPPICFANGSLPPRDELPLINVQTAF